MLFFLLIYLILDVTKISAALIPHTIEEPQVRSRAPTSRDSLVAAVAADVVGVVVAADVVVVAADVVAVAGVEQMIVRHFDCSSWRE